MSEDYVRLLGTAATKPTRHRNVSSLVVKYRHLKFLVDAGEGTLRQLLRFQEGLDFDAIFFTHGHGDHVWGIPSLVECMALGGRTEPLVFYCTKPTVGTLRSLLALTSKNRRFEVVISQVYQGVSLTIGPGVTIMPLALKHSYLRTVGYILRIAVAARLDGAKLESLGLQGPLVGRLLREGSCNFEGKTVLLKQVEAQAAREIRVFLGGDTRPVAHPFDYDLMIHQCTLSDQAAEEAAKKGHTTVSEALAHHRLARKLVLSHVGERAEPELRTGLPSNVVVGRDGDKFYL